MPVYEKTVQLFATGGTIANPPDVEGYITGERLIADVPEVEKIASVSVEDIASRSSESFTPGLLVDLHDRCHAVLNGTSPPDGIVVTSGSNAMEEIAFFLHVTLDTHVPIVCTAAQRNHGIVGNDGDRNLVDAVRVASHSNATDRGAMVVVGDVIHSARDVRKVVSSRPDAWSSGEHGGLGFTDKHGRVTFYRMPERLHTFKSEFSLEGYEPDVLRRIPVTCSALGADGSTIEAAIDADVPGIVVAAYPTGHPANPQSDEYPGQATALEHAVDEGIPVVVSHRGQEGWTYAYREDGYPHKAFVSADTLSPAKARILLSLALQRTTEPAELAAIFDRY